MAGRTSQSRNDYRCSIERNQNGKYCIRMRVQYPRHSWSLGVFFLASSFDRAMKKLEESLHFLQRNEEKLWFWGVDRAADMGFSAEFLKDAGLQMAKVPYRDINQAPNDLAEGRIQVLMTSLAAVQAQMQTGRVKVVAVTSRARASTVPEVPTVIEAGYPALALDGLVGLFGPRGMSSELRDRIVTDFRAVAAADTLIATRLEATGQIVDIRGPAEFAAGVEEQRAKLAAIAKTLGIKPAQ